MASKSIWLTIPTTLTAMLVLGSISALAGVAIAQEARSPLLMGMSLVIVLLGILRRTRGDEKVVPIGAVFAQASLVGLILASSQVVVRHFGISSTAFGDSFTIMLSAQELKGAESAFGGFDGFLGLKRGFALPALESFGGGGEYLVGVLPLFFFAAVSTTIYFFWVLTQSRGVTLAVAIVLVSIAATSEAFTRHIVFMNTHAIAWMLLSLLLVHLAIYIRGQQEPPDWFGILMSFSAIGFLRFDYLVLYAAVTLAFMLIYARSNPWHSMLIAIVQLASAGLWISIMIPNFPFFGPLGHVWILSSGAAIACLIVLGQRALKSPIDVVHGPSLLIISIVFLAVITLGYSPTRTMLNVFVNLFLWEGLWGLTPLFLVLIFVWSRLTKKPSENTSSPVFAKLGLATLSTYLLAKGVDTGVYQFGVSWNDGVSLARIGFGDSLNRTLVFWTPFVLLPLVRIFGKNASPMGAKSQDKLLK